MLLGENTGPKIAARQSVSASKKLHWILRVLPFACAIMRLIVHHQKTDGLFMII